MYISYMCNFYVFKEYACIAQCHKFKKYVTYQIILICYIQYKSGIYHACICYKMNIFSVGMISTAYFVRHSRRPSVCLSVCLNDYCFFKHVIPYAALVSTPTSFSVYLQDGVSSTILLRLQTFPFLLKCIFCFRASSGARLGYRVLKKYSWDQIFLGSSHTVVKNGRTDGQWTK